MSRDELLILYGNPKSPVPKLRHQYKKVVFIRVDEDVALARSSEFMKTCHNMNIIVHTTVGYASSLNGKVKVQIRQLIISRELFY